MKTGGIKTKNYNKTIIFALLIVTILFMSTGMAAAKETKLVVRSADSSANKVVIYGTFAPETIEINAGEEVTWFNFKKPKGSIVLESEDELWEETTLYYGKAFSYTFEEPGTYIITLKDNPEIKGTVKVSASELQEEDLETPGETANVENPTATTEASSASNSGKSDEKNVQNEEKILIYSTTFSPETIEIEKGDTVTWINLKRPKGASVLQSDDGLWEDTTLYYGKAFSHTFEEAGTYTFSLEAMPEAKATVIVT